MTTSDQIALDAQDLALLEAQSEQLGVPISELVHRAIQRCYGSSRARTRPSDGVFSYLVTINAAANDAWIPDDLFDEPADYEPINTNRTNP